MKKIMSLALVALLTTGVVSTGFAQEKEKCKKECCKKCNKPGCGKCDDKNKETRKA